MDDESQAIYEEGLRDAEVESGELEAFERRHGLCPICGGDLIGRGLKIGTLKCRDCGHIERVDD